MPKSQTESPLVILDDAHLRRVREAFSLHQENCRRALRDPANPGYVDNLGAKGIILKSVADDVIRFRFDLDHLSKRALAKAVGVTEGSIRNLENNATRLRPPPADGKGRFVHASKPHAPTLEGLFRFRSLPASARLDIELLLNWGTYVLAADSRERLAA